jgi:prepilin-type N-terminal cleavage/methylation domain-containing protein
MYGSPQENVHPGNSDAVSISNADSKQDGFTLTEVIVVVYVVAMLAAIVINTSLDSIEKARLARCMVELRGIQTAVWMGSDDGNSFMDANTFWGSHYHGSKPGPYFYLLDGDPNNGHGNDLDGVDEENPGASDPDKKDIKFAVLCQHDHKWLGEYVFLTDEEPPKVVGGLDGIEDPGYERFTMWEGGGPGGDNG